MSPRVVRAERPCQRWEAALSLLAHCGAKCTLIVPSSGNAFGHSQWFPYAGASEQFQAQQTFLPFAMGNAQPMYGPSAFFPLGVYLPQHANPYPYVGGGGAPVSRQSASSSVEWDAPHGGCLTLKDSEVKAEIKLPAIIKTKMWLQLPDGTELDSKAAQAANIKVITQ